jgi:hypothetical protein
LSLVQYRVQSLRLVLLVPASIGTTRAKLLTQQ